MAAANQDVERALASQISKPTSLSLSTLKITTMTLGVSCFSHTVSRLMYSVTSTAPLSLLTMMTCHGRRGTAWSSFGYTAPWHNHCSAALSKPVVPLETSGYVLRTNSGTIKNSSNPTRSWLAHHGDWRPYSTQVLSNSEIYLRSLGQPRRCSPWHNSCDVSSQRLEQEVWQHHQCHQTQGTFSNVWFSEIHASHRRNSPQEGTKDTGSCRQPFFINCSHGFNRETTTTTVQ